MASPDNTLRATRPWQVATYALVCLGVGLRLRQYVSARCLWIDEVFVAMNIEGATFAELTGPLVFNQAAPLMFLMTQKLATLGWGTSEGALRLLPLSAGVAALLVFVRFARALLPPSFVCFCTALFACSDVLVYFSNEAKQYSLDLLVAVVLLHLGVTWQARSLSWREAAGAASIGALAIMASFGTPFVLAGIGIAWWSHAPRQRTLKLAAVAGTWIAVLLLYWYTVLQHARGNRFLQEYWTFAFAPFPPTSLEDLGVVLSPGSRAAFHL